jgi:hypothetical protein
MTRYFIRRGSEERGPFPAQTIKRLAANKKILRTDEVRAEGTDRYVQASSVRGLFATPTALSRDTALQSLPPPLPVKKSARAATPATPSPVMPLEDSQSAPTGQADCDSHTKSPRRPLHTFLRFCGYSALVAAGLMWFVVEPMMREPLKGEGIEKAARWLNNDNENVPITILSLCLLMLGMVCIVKSFGRGLTEVSTPEQLGLDVKSAQDHLFAVGYSSGGKHEDVICGLLLIRPNDVLFRPDRLNPLQNGQVRGLGFVMKAIRKNFAISDCQDWRAETSSILKVVRSGWIVRSVRVKTMQEVHGREDHFFYGTGRNAFSRQFQNRLFECFAEASQRSLKQRA